MMNPGHIDPGYEGVLWFSLINLSETLFRCREGDHIATVLVLEYLRRLRETVEGPPWTGGA